MFSYYEKGCKVNLYVAFSFIIIVTIAFFLLIYICQSAANKAELSRATTQGLVLSRCCLKRWCLRSLHPISLFLVIPRHKSRFPKLLAIQLFFSPVFVLPKRCTELDDLGMFYTREIFGLFSSVVRFSLKENFTSLSDKIDRIVYSTAVLYDTQNIFATRDTKRSYCIFREIF